MLRGQIVATGVNRSLTIDAQRPSRNGIVTWCGGCLVQSVDTPFVLSLTGSLTTPRAEAVHAEVFAVLSGHSNVAVDCSNASEMDVAFIQILIAANRFASQFRKTIALAAPPSGLLAETLIRCGFSLPKRQTTALAEVLSLSST